MDAELCGLFKCARMIKGQGNALEEQRFSFLVLVEPILRRK
jgi:hypothetical protein